MSAARSAALALVLLAAAVLAGGCASEEQKADVEQARRWKREAMGARLVAGAIAGEMADEAARMQHARKQGSEPAAAASQKRLDDGKAVLEAIEDAENSLSLATRYYEVRSGLDLPPRYVERLDLDVTRLAEVAADILGKRVPVFAPMPGKPCAPAVAEALRKELERDRAALRAYRVDIGLITQLGGASPEN